jgi:hypothetical protein
MFLWDDDAYPKAAGWWKPYVDSPEPHLAYQFLDFSTGRKLGDIGEVHRDAHHVAYTGQRGVMLYYHRSAIEKVGGFDLIYERGMYEHSDLALRIHNAGLTSWAFADVANSADLIHSLDEHRAISRSVPLAEREAAQERNVEIHNARWAEGYSGYAEYRTKRNVVVTTLLTSEPDPQRGRKWPADPGALEAWSKSISGAQAIVLADELETAPQGAELVKVDAVKANVYFRRWLHVYQYLRDNPDIDKVWVTDGSDVEMLHEPWGQMQPRVIYTGSEPKTYSDPWCRKNHPEQLFQEFIAEHERDMLLNAGLLGGSREDVMEFAHRIVNIFYGIRSLQFWRRETQESVGDMMAFGLVAHRYFADRLSTGPGVHTLFKAEERTSAWWKHK